MSILRKVSVHVRRIESTVYMPGSGKCLVTDGVSCLCKKVGNAPQEQGRQGERETSSIHPPSYYY